MNDESFQARRVRKIHELTLIIGGGFLAALCFHILAHFVFHAEYPWNTFLFDPRDRFMDFLGTLPVFKTFGFSMSIWPSVSLLYFPFSYFEDRTALVLFLSIFSVSYLALMFWKLWTPVLPWWRNVFYAGTISLSSYPFLFAWDRANIESYLFLSAAAFVFLFQRARYTLASCFLAFAIAMKLFPAAFVVLYLKRRRFKQLAVLSVVTAVLACVHLFVKDFSVTLERTNAFFELYLRDYTIGDAGLAYGHTLFGMLKTLFYFFSHTFAGFDGHQWLREHATVVLRSYTALTLIVYATAASFILLKRDLPYWRQVAILVSLFCMLPNVSADYKLLHLYTPLLLFVNAEERSRKERLVLWIFGALLVPKAYFNFPAGGTFATVVTPLLFVAFLYVLFTDRPMGRTVPTPAT